MWFSYVNWESGREDGDDDEGDDDEGVDDADDVDDVDGVDGEDDVDVVDDVDDDEDDEEEEEEGQLTQKSNNPNLKGGEQMLFALVCNCSCKKVMFFHCFAFLQFRIRIFNKDATV